MYWYSKSALKLSQVLPCFCMVFIMSSHESIIRSNTNTSLTSIQWYPFVFDHFKKLREYSLGGDNINICSVELIYKIEPKTA